MNETGYLVQFTIYIAGQSLQNKEFVDLYQSTCATHLQEGAFDITVIDLTSNPASAESAGILAVPTIIRTYPSPSRKVVGRFNAADAGSAVGFLTQDLTLQTRL